MSEAAVTHRLPRSPQRAPGALSSPNDDGRVEMLIVRTR